MRTSLTQADRRRGRKPRSSTKARIANACRLCGLVLENVDRKYCDECLPLFDLERTRQLSSAGRTALASMRTSPNDPAKTPEARAKQREKSRAESLAARAWEREHGKPDPVEYQNRIYPVIQRMTVPELVSVTGLSQYHCWRVRKGDSRLHARHWSSIVASKDAK